MEKLINFAVEDIQQIQFEDYNEDEYAIARVNFLSDKPNSHGLVISREVLQEYAPTVLGKWMVAKMNMLGTDAESHDPKEVIMGSFPKEQEVEFVEDEDGYLCAYAKAVISKVYAKDYYKMFESENNRPVSVEMAIVTKNGGDMNDTVLSFNIVGVTTLGLTVKPSVPGADVTMVRFSEEEADKYFNEHNLTLFKEKVNMAEEKYEDHPISTSKEDIYEGEWDGQKAKQDLVKEKNYKNLAPKVCMKLEEGWENREVTKLGYPVMMLYNGKWVYSRDGLASALGYAKKENETAVVNKIEKIYKKLGLETSDGKEAKSEMSEIEFSAVNIGELWGHVYSAIRDRDAWDYCINGIYEEDNQKFAVLVDRDQKLYRMNFTLTEEGFDYDEELVEVKQEFTDTDNIKKFAEPENVEQYTQFAKEEKPEDEPEKTEMSADEMKAEMARLSDEIEKRDNIIMEKDNLIKDYEAELCDLRAFKQTCMEAERGTKVNTIMAEVSKFMDKAQAEQYRDEGLKCEFAEIDAWANKVKASVFDKMAKQSENTEFTRMSAPVVNKGNETGSVWDRI